MPTYHYCCKSCKHEFEELQRIAENPLTACPSCKKHSLTRMISGGSGLVFKGNGFYITDYKSKSSSVNKKSEKTDTKPELKTDTKSDTKSSGTSKSFGDSTKKE